MLVINIISSSTLLLCRAELSISQCRQLPKDQRTKKKKLNLNMNFSDR